MPLLQVDPEERKRAIKALRKEKKKERKLEAKEQGELPAMTMQQTFKYRQNQIFNQLLQSERDKEASVILQAFKYLVDHNLVHADNDPVK